MTDVCNSCGTKWIEHMGVEGTCARLQTALAELEIAKTNYLECADARDQWEAQAFAMQEQRDAALVTLERIAGPTPGKVSAVCAPGLAVAHERAAQAALAKYQTQTP